MAMNPMQKKARTSFLLGMFLTLVITGLVIAFLIYQIGKMKEEQKAIGYKDVYVANQDIKSGDNVFDKLYKVRVVNNGTEIVGFNEKTKQPILGKQVLATPNNAITDENHGRYINSLTTSKVQIDMGTVITEDMVNPEGVPDTADVRLQEYNMIVLPTQLKENESIDIRLRLPTGEDYIVVSKKHVEQTNASTIWIKVSEDEILTMSNAIVEAYIMNGALLYATTYSDAGMQEKSTPTYVASNSVIQLMNIEPNIVPIAKSALADRYKTLGKNRDVINEALNNYADDAITNVEDDLAQEIQKQQSARQQYVDSLGATMQTTP